MTMPATGTQISMGRMGHAYNNVPSGSQSVSVGNSGSLKLNNQIGRSPVANTPISSVFGGRPTPFTY